MEPFIVTLEPIEKKGAAYSHEGEEFLFVIDGRVEVQLGEFTDVPAGLRSRFPVVKATIAIDTPSVRAIIADKAGMARERMRTLLLQELNYEINVKGGG